MHATTMTLEQATSIAGEHLTAYGHRIPGWRVSRVSARHAAGCCTRCAGRVIIYLDSAGRPAALADPPMVAPGEGVPGLLDYAECAGRC